MALLTVQNVDLLNGLVPTYASAAGGGDTFPNDGKTMLHVKNGGGSSITLTVTTQVTSQNVPGLGPVDVANETYTVANGSERMIGFFNPSRFNNASGQVAIGYSSATSVTVAAIRTPQPEV